VYPFSFDKIFRPQTAQAVVFEEVERLVRARVRIRVS